MISSLLKSVVVPTARRSSIITFSSVNNMSSSSTIEKIASDARPSQKSGSILETVGKTPLVKLSNKMAPENVNVYVKCEAFNPMGSVKDRLALGCIEVSQNCITSLLSILFRISHIHVIRRYQYSGPRKMDTSSQVKQSWNAVQEILVSDWQWYATRRAIPLFVLWQNHSPLNAVSS